jgi:hypothetical protein
MFICNHVVAGAAVGLVLADYPGCAFAAGVVSHLVLDAIPHWGIDAGTADSGKVFLRVARIDGCTGCAMLGLILALAPKKTGMAAALAGSVLPDIDKPCLHFFGANPVPDWFQNFHSRIQRQSAKRMRQEQLSCVIGGTVVLALLLAARRSATRRGSRSLRVL